MIGIGLKRFTVSMRIGTQLQNTARGPFSKRPLV